MSYHTTPVRIETQPNGRAEIIMGVVIDGTVVTLRQELDDNRVATLLQALAGVVNVRTQQRARAYDRPLAGYTPPASDDFLRKAAAKVYAEAARYGDARTVAAVNSILSDHDKDKIIDFRPGFPFEDRPMTNDGPLKGGDPDPNTSAYGGNGG